MRSAVILAAASNAARVSEPLGTDVVNLVTIGPGPKTGPENRKTKMTYRTRLLRALAPLALVVGGFLAGLASLSAHAEAGAGWGAIASRQGAYGFSYNQASRGDAERAALAQCNRVASRSGQCEVRAYFDRSCAALATGNFGEWGAGIAPTEAAAIKTAIGTCESYLPTEPCKVTVKVCSQG